MTVGLTYTPNIQFAPFYVAQSMSYYKDAGLDVKLRHHSASEPQFAALSAGREDAVLAGGDEMLQAHSQNVPVVDVATIFRKYPAAVMVRKDSGIRSPADLRGKTIGTPGPYGETYFALLATLEGAGLKIDDVKVKNIGFTQQAALTGRKVDAVTGYVNNDQVGFDAADVPVRSIGDSPPLVAAGIGASQDALDKRSSDMKAFVRATLKGVQYTIDHPDEAVEISKKFVPGLRQAKNLETSKAVLKATIPLLRAGSAPRLGYNDPQLWSQMHTFMKEHGLLKESVKVSSAYSNSYTR